MSSGLFWSCRFGFTVLLFLLRSLVSMNFNVVYIYTAEVRSQSAGFNGAFFKDRVWGDRCFGFSGVPHGGALSGDGFLYVVQSHRRNDRSVHCSGALAVLLNDQSFQVFGPVYHCFVCTSGADVSVSDSGSLSVRCGLCALRSRKLPDANRNQRTSSAGENVILYELCSFFLCLNAVVWHVCLFGFFQQNSWWCLWTNCCSLLFHFGYMCKDFKYDTDLRCCCAFINSSKGMNVC